MELSKVALSHQSLFVSAWWYPQSINLGDERRSDALNKSLTILVIVPIISVLLVIIIVPISILLKRKSLRVKKIFQGITFTRKETKNRCSLRLNPLKVNLKSTINMAVDTGGAKWRERACAPHNSYATY